MWIYDNSGLVLLLLLGLVVATSAGWLWTMELLYVETPSRMRTVARWTAVYMTGCSRVFRMEPR
jgi:hypothetical protein